MAQHSPYTTDSRTAQELRDKGAELTDRMENTVKAVAERGREVGENVQHVAENMKSAVDTSVRDQPMATLAVAAVIGFVLGALWKS